MSPNNLHSLRVEVLRIKEQQPKVYVELSKLKELPYLKWGEAFLHVKDHEAYMELKKLLGILLTSGVTFRDTIELIIGEL